MYSRENIKIITHKSGKSGSLWTSPF